MKWLGDLFVPMLGPLLLVVGFMTFVAILAVARCGVEREGELPLPFRGANPEGGYYRWSGTLHEFTARIPELPEGTTVRTDLLQETVEGCEGGREQCCRWVYVLMLVEEERPHTELGRVEIQTVQSFGVRLVQVWGRQAEVEPWVTDLAESVEGRGGRCQ